MHACEARQHSARENVAADVGPLQKLRVSIEQLIAWTYRDQKADRMTDLALLEAERAAAGIRDQRSTRDGSIGAGRAELGLSAIVFPRRVLGALHADAEAIHDRVNMLADGYLLVLYGRQAARPDWVPVAELGLVPEFKGGAWAFDQAGRPLDGSFRVVYTPNREASHCALELAADPAFVRAQRAEYRRWRAGLLALRNACRDQGSPRLRAYAVTEELPPAEPWKLYRSRAAILKDTRD